MPNHTTNQLTVTGPESSIKKMKAAVKSLDRKDEFCCNSIIPMPAELRNTEKGSSSPRETVEEAHEREQREAKLVEDYGHYNWYDWSIEHWGTKWDIYPMGEVIEWEGNDIAFWSAWSPPIPVITWLSKQFTDLKFVLNYSDEGGYYAGQLVCENGEAEDNCTEDSVLIEAKNKEMGIYCGDDEE